MEKVDRKIVDGFIFYNELDMLTYRLNILNDIVDYFIIVESTHTFIGKEKPLFFNENRHLFEKFQNKIIHVIVDDFPHKYPTIDFSKKEQWRNEFYQRDAISRGLSQIVLTENDIIIISDVDEIPDPNTLTAIKEYMVNIDMYILEMDFYYYNLYTRLVEKWYFPKIISYRKYRELNDTCNNIRYTSCSYIQKGGWHLSYFGDKHFIKNKIIHFSHQEFNTNEFTDIQKIETKMKMSRDLFDRENEKMNRISINMNKYLPPKYHIYLRNYYVCDNELDD